MSFFNEFRVRGVAAGLSAALDYVLSFISTKTYYNLETSLSMPGLTLLNCMIAGFGIVLIYLIMPETENRTLEDIEMHFSDNTKKITDRKIARIIDGPNLEKNDEICPDENTSGETGEHQFSYRHGHEKGRDNVAFEFNL